MCRTTKTVTTAVTMKASVATSDRTERRESPQTPCPLVQPPPTHVPRPTRSPPTSRTGVGAEIKIAASGSTMDRCIKTPTTRPLRKRTRHTKSPADRGGSIPASTPLTPASRPFSANRSVAEAPISAPPTSAETGVKFSIATSLQGARFVQDYSAAVLRLWEMLSSKRLENQVG